MGANPACLHNWLAVIRSRIRCRLIGIVRSPFVNRVLLPFAQLRVSVLLKILDQIAAFYRHLLDLDRNLFEEPPTRRDFFLKFAVRRDHFLGCILK